MLQACDSSMNDFDLKCSLPSSEITLGPSFTPLKDLASSKEFQNDSSSNETDQSETASEPARIPRSRKACYDRHNSAH